MFKWLNKQGVEKEGEFSFQRIDRFYYEYTEGENRLKIPVELGAKGEDIYLFDAAGFIFGPDRKRIADNIAAALKFMGLEAQIR